MFWLLCVLAASDVAAAQASASPGDTPVQLEGVEVTARRGAAAMPPQHELDGAQIDALGAEDIAAVVGQVNAQFGGRAPPVVIVNGQRVADPEAFLGFPPDALTRVEVLPPSATATYGGAADPSRRVINIVLQKQFRSHDGALTASGPTAGGATSLIGDIRRSSILDLNTSRSGLRVSGDTSLRADERADYLESHPESAGATLRPQTRRVSVDTARTRSLGTWRGSLRAMASAQSSRFIAATGGTTVANRSEGQSLNLTGGLGGSAAGWMIVSSLSGQASRNESSGLTDARTNNRSANLNLSANRTLLTLPAGGMTMELSGRAFRSHSETKGGTPRSFFSSGEDVDLALAVPLLNASTDSGAPFGGRLGDASLRLGAGMRRADSGQGDNLSGNLFWSPTKSLNLVGAWSRATDVPMDNQRFAPAIYGAPIVVFDFRTGQSVEVLPLTGGNPDLRTSRRDRVTFGVSSGPFTPLKLYGGVNYERSEAVDGIGSLPPATADVEAAFPDRFQRDADGRLVSIDQRSINIASSRSTSLSSNLNFAIPLDKEGAPGPISQVQIYLNHSIRLSDATVIREGLPSMDRLAGDGGGAPRQDLTLSLNARRGPWGFNAGANWRGGYRIRNESGRNGDGDLLVDDFGSLSVKISYLVSRQAAPQSKAQNPVAGPAGRRNRGFTLTADVDNLLDARPRARLGDGRPAPGYGRDDRDPLGRVVRIGLAGRF
ncbi:TonB-dependent receptor [Caulobacter hibisci]|uniref:TonB-dependent receptor n=1 Tax=Caulobacter hibisci TaxID=2035993 RepID=A0ABS0ST49_9CAUL|nr:TonB-dependent receptor [Caulobacter hibisci]MBI1682804.1 TonB-dependent receptor [Caulobacter hibisci]